MSELEKSAAQEEASIQSKSQVKGTNMRSRWKKSQSTKKISSSNNQNIGPVQVSVEKTLENDLKSSPEKHPKIVSEPQKQKDEPENKAKEKQPKSRLTPPIQRRTTDYEPRLSSKASLQKSPIKAPKIKKSLIDLIKTFFRNLLGIGKKAKNPSNSEFKHKKTQQRAPYKRYNRAKSNHYRKH